MVGWVEVVLEYIQRMQHRPAGVCPQPDATITRGAVRLVIGRHRRIVEVLGAKQQPLTVNDHHFGVLISISIVDGRRDSGVVDHEPALPTGIFNLLAHPLVLVADAARRPAFEEDGDAHAGCRARRHGLGQFRIVEGVAFIVDAGCRRADRLSHIEENVIRRNQVGDGRRLREFGCLEVAVKVPAGVQNLLAVDGVVGRLRPVVPPKNWTLPLIKYNVPKGVSR